MRKKKPIEVERNLLFDDVDQTHTNTTNSSLEDEQLYPHLRNNTYVQLIHDSNSYVKGQVPPQFRNYFL